MTIIKIRIKSGQMVSSQDTSLSTQLWEGLMDSGRFNKILDTKLQSPTVLNSPDVPIIELCLL